MHDDISRNETFFMTTTTLNVTPITENFQTCKPAVLDIPMYNMYIVPPRNGTRVLVAYIGMSRGMGLRYKKSGCLTALCLYSAFEK